MTPNSPINLDNLIKEFNRLKKYRLCPAKINENGKTIEPYFDKGILKRILNVKNAWEIGENDFDCVAIKENDNPVIPEGNNHVPILDVLKRKNKK